MHVIAPRLLGRLGVTKGHSESILDGDDDARGGEQNMPDARAPLGRVDV